MRVWTTVRVFTLAASFFHSLPCCCSADKIALCSSQVQRPICSWEVSTNLVGTVPPVAFSTSILFQTSAFSVVVFIVRVVVHNGLRQNLLHLSNQENECDHHQCGGSQEQCPLLHVQRCRWRQKSQKICKACLRIPPCVSRTWFWWAQLGNNRNLHQVWTSGPWQAGQGLQDAQMCSRPWL